MIALPPFSFWRSLTQTSKDSGSWRQGDTDGEVHGLSSSSEVAASFESPSSNAPSLQSLGRAELWKEPSESCWCYKPQNTEQGAWDAAGDPPWEVLGGESKDKARCESWGQLGRKIGEGKGKEGHGGEEVERRW